MSVRINNQTFPAEYMTTPDQLRMGMMGRKSLNGCMVFKLKKGYHSFWMKDCVIPLDMIFVLNNKISKIFKDCKPCEDNCKERFTGAADHVIEFPSGTSNTWKIGDDVTMYLGSPQNPV